MPGKSTSTVKVFFHTVARSQQLFDAGERLRCADASQPKANSDCPERPP